MADLAAALDALTGPRPHLKPGPPCSVALYLDGLLERDAALHARVVALIDDPSVPGAALARALNEDGAELSAYSLRWHRRRARGGCRCER